MKKIKPIPMMIVMMLCMSLTSITAFASGGEETIASEEPTQTIETITPDGNLTLVDDLESYDEENKQFITLQSKNGNYFYLVIDRANDEENVYFLNLVDEADLLALIEDAPVEITVECTCDEHCEVGSVNTECPVCVSNMASCQGEYVEPDPVVEEIEIAEEPEETSGSSTMALIALAAIFLVACGGAIYYLKFMKPKSKNKGNPNLDEYDFEDDEELVLEDITEDVTEEE